MSKNEAQNTMKLFFWWSLFYGVFFGQVWEKSGKNPSHPQNLPAPTPCVLHHHIFRDFLVLF